MFDTVATILRKVILSRLGNKKDKTIIQVEPQHIESEMAVVQAYVRCVRCDLVIFLPGEWAKADGVKCPECGVTNLLGNYFELRRKGTIRVARAKKNGNVD